MRYFVGHSCYAADVHSRNDDALVFVRLPLGQTALVAFHFPLVHFKHAALAAVVAAALFLLGLGRCDGLGCSRHWTRGI